MRLRGSCLHYKGDNVANNKLENMISQALVRSPVFWNCWPLLFPLNISIVKMQIGQFTHLHALLRSSSVSPAKRRTCLTPARLAHTRQMHKLSIHDWIADRVISSGIDRLQGWVGTSIWLSRAPLLPSVEQHLRSPTVYLTIIGLQILSRLSWSHHPGSERFPDSWAD